MHIIITMKNSLEILTLSLLVLSLVFRPEVLQTQDFVHHFNLNENQCSYLEGDTLWTGTNVGLVGWDLSREKVFAHYYEGNSNIGDNRIRAIGRSTDGDLWVFGPKAVSWQHAGKWETHHFFLPGEKNPWKVCQLSFGLNGDVWVGTDQGLVRYRDGMWEVLAVEGCAPCGAQFVDRNSRLWFRSKAKGRMLFISDGVVGQLENDGVPVYYTDLFIDSRQRKWLGVKNGYRYLAGEVWTDVTSPFKGGHTYPDFIQENANGQIWLDAGRDVATVVGDSIHFWQIKERVKEAHGNTGEPVGDILDYARFDDADWIIFSKGLYKIDENQFFPYPGFHFSAHLSRIEYIDHHQCTEGGLVLVTSRFLVKFKAGRFKRIGAATHVLNNDVERVQPGKGNDLWFCSRNGITKITAGTIDTFELSASYPAPILQFDGKGRAWGRLYAGTPGYFRVGGKQKTLQFGKKNLPGRMGAYAFVIPEMEQKAWFFNYNLKGYFLTDENWEKAPDSPGRGYFRGWVKRGDRYWIAKDSLYKYRMGDWQYSGVRFEPELVSSELLHLDQQGNIWAIVGRDSVVRIDPEERHTGFNLREGLAGEKILGFSTGKKINLIWSASSMLVYDGYQWKNFPGDFASFNVMQYEDLHGNWWLHQNIYGLTQISEKGVRDYLWGEIGAPFTHGVPYGRFMDGAGNLWVSTSAGIAVMRPDESWVFYQEGIGRPAYHSMVQDKHGAVWVGTRTGLVRFENEHFKVFNSTTGLMSDWVKELVIHDDVLFIVHQSGYSTLDLR